MQKGEDIKDGEREKRGGEEGERRESEGEKEKEEIIDYLIADIIEISAFEIIILYNINLSALVLF